MCRQESGQSCGSAMRSNRPGEATGTYSPWREDAPTELQCRLAWVRSLRLSSSVAKGGRRETCTVEGCGRGRVGWGLCGLHYARQMRSGSVRPSHRSQARAETIAPDGTRKCWKCGERKPFTAEYFRPDGRRPGELKGTCAECLREAVRRCWLPARYGIDQAEFDAMLARQSGACGLCGNKFDGATKATGPHVDHCHKTGVVRGLLCHHCNVMLGHAKESADLLRKAADYVERAA